jgi:hypothetical protein
MCVGWGVNMCLKCAVIMLRNLLLLLLLLIYITYHELHFTEKLIAVIFLTLSTPLCVSKHIISVSYRQTQLH